MMRSDHYAVVVKIMLRDKWEFCRKIGKEMKAKERLEDLKVGRAEGAEKADGSWLIADRGNIWKIKG